MLFSNIFFSFTRHQRQGSPRLLRQQPIDPSLVSPGQLRNNVLFYFLWVATRVDHIRRDTQPVDGYVVQGGIPFAARNEYHLVFASVKVVSDDEVVSVSLQRGLCFRNKQSRISLKLMKRWIPSTMVHGCTVLMH